MAELFVNILKDLMVKPQREIRKGLGQAGDELLRLSGNKVPLDMATLRNSGDSKMISDYEVEIGYHTRYAAYQHEGIRADGTHVVRFYTTAGTGKKFLENPLKENLSKWEKIIGVALVSGIKK